MPLSGIRYDAASIKRFNSEHPNYNASDYIGLSFKNFEIFNPQYFQIERLYFNHSEIKFEADVVDTSTITEVRPVPLIDSGNLDSSQLGFYQLRESHQGFTLFSADIVNAICAYSNYITISGKAVEYGQMAYSRDDLDGESAQDNRYFGVKMEGDMGRLSSLSQLLENPSDEFQDIIVELQELISNGDENRIQQLIASSVEAPIMDIGTDCPPKWEMVFQKIVRLLEQNQPTSRGVVRGDKALLSGLYFPLIQSAWLEFQNKSV